MARAVQSAVQNFSPVMSAFEITFVQTVLEHRGILQQPTLAQFSAALIVLQRYDQQCEDNPSRAGAWEPDVEGETLIALRAKAFLLFGVTKPSVVQWRKAHESLFGPLLCETCGLQTWPAIGAPCRSQSPSANHRRADMVKARHRFDPFTEGHGPYRVVVMDRSSLLVDEWPLPEGTDLRAEIERQALKWEGAGWIIERPERGKWAGPWFFMRKADDRWFVNISPAGPASLRTATEDLPGRS